jgi:alpha-amylase/alpha-mannosidase (GH57 family)
MTTAIPKKNRFVCIHGHFYQPPRENPWLEAVEREEGASPYHDWNERISAECYAANGRSRVLDEKGKIARVSNNYQKISFNFGPTLLSWMAEKAGVALKGIQQADRLSQKDRNGHGNALAQAYNHTILPLANARDLLTQIRWGKADFIKRFNRQPEGMWLPETAVNLKTLKALAQEKIRFTILAPHQAKRFRPSGQKEWIETHGAINPRHPYWCRLSKDEKIVLFFYDGGISHGIAFENLLQSGEDLVQRVLNGFDPEDPNPQLVHVATDGESYGHHRPFGDMALAYALLLLEKDPSLQLTNYGQFLNRFPPQWEVEINENTSWSCAHGIERWRLDCGCRMSGGENRQAWRAPLREGLDDLKKKLDLIFEVLGEGFWKDPWQARDDYIHIILDRSHENLDRFFSHQNHKHSLAPAERVQALKLLEMQRHGLLMFTSCGWFFDDISGLESTQILKYAGRAVQLAQDFGHDLEKPLLSYLKKAPSNIKEFGNGEKVWEIKVRPYKIDLSQVLAHQAIDSIYQKEWEERIYCYKITDQDKMVLPQNGSHLALGRLKAASTITLEEEKIIFAVLHFGGVDFQCHLKPFQDEGGYEAVRDQILHLYRKSSLADVYDRIKETFDPRRFNLKDLFSEERQKIINLLLQERVEKSIRLLEDWIKEDTGTLIKLIDMGVVLPQPIKMSLNMIFGRILRKGISEAFPPKGRLEPLEEFFLRAKELGFPLSPDQIRRRLEISLEQAIHNIRNAPDPGAVFTSLSAIIGICRRFDFDLNLWNIQNALLDACLNLPTDNPLYRRPYESFAAFIEIPGEVIRWEAR